MRILMISDVYFPRVNGVSTSIRTFREDLRRIGVDSTLIAPEYPGAEPAADVIRIPSRYLFFDPEDRLMRRRPIRVLTDELQGRYDLLHVHTPFVAHGAGLRLARSLGLPLVESYHTYFEEYFYHYLPVLPKAALRKIACWLSRYQCNQVDAVIVPTPMIAEVLRGYGVSPPVHVLPTGIDCDRLRQGDGSRFRQRFGIAPERPVVLHVGRVALEKNINFLIRMLPEVVRSVPEVLFVLAGEGPALARHRAQIVKAGLEDNVLFVGYLDRETSLLDCYAAANVFVFASRTETQGLVLLEAMAIGVPVVSTAVLGTRAVLEHAPGAVVVAEDCSAFAGAVIEILNSPGRQRALSAAAQTYAASWSGAAMARRLCALYESLLGGPPAAAALEA